MRLRAKQSHGKTARSVKHLATTTVIASGLNCDNRARTRQKGMKKWIKHNSNLNAE
jgi:hypothetical protein